MRPLATWIRALPERHGKRTLVVLGLIVALGLGLRAYAVVDPAAEPADDSRAYFGLAKALKIWAISSLGAKWSYRVLVVPGEPLVTSGPYRFIPHPNYLAVVGEIVSVAAIVWAPLTGIVATIGFGRLMIARIRIEDRALGRLK